MIIIRPSRMEDVDQLVQLATMTSFGLSTLPVDQEYLEERVQASIRGFKQISRKPRGETYLLVMVDTQDGNIIGTSGIVSKVGGFEPFYAYRVDTEIFESEQLHVRKEIQVLKLATEHDGPCEIGSLFLNPKYRGRKLARLLSLSRFLFIAEFPGYFEKRVIAEMRGIVDNQGYSPFWEALGRHFFDIDYPKADYLSMKNKTFIADLMPRSPIYIPLLSKEAQTVIGRVHEKTIPALRMLESRGFTRCGMVDIFEAGPIISCNREDILTISESKRAFVSEITSDRKEDFSTILSNTRCDFRACFGSFEGLGNDEVKIDRITATALEVVVGDPVRYAPSGVVKE